MIRFADTHILHHIWPKSAAAFEYLIASVDPDFTEKVSKKTTSAQKHSPEVTAQT
jgi:hypothetical protein